MRDLRLSLYCALIGWFQGALVEYYYYWKKTPAANSSRPHTRRRRPRKQASTPSSQQTSNEDGKSTLTSSHHASLSPILNGARVCRCWKVFCSVALHENPAHTMWPTKKSKKKTAQIPAFYCSPQQLAALRSRL